MSRKQYESKKKKKKRKRGGRSRIDRNIMETSRLTSESKEYVFVILVCFMHLLNRLVVTMGKNERGMKEQTKNINLENHSVNVFEDFCSMSLIT